LKLDSLAVTVYDAQFGSTSAFRQRRSEDEVLPRTVPQRHTTVRWQTTIQI